jgi:hypothetical protein
MSQRYFLFFSLLIGTSFIGTFSSPQTLVALQSMESDAVIMNDQNAQNPSSESGKMALQAEQFILLRPGLTAEKGCSFKASIKSHVFGLDFNYTSNGFGNDIDILYPILDNSMLDCSSGTIDYKILFGDSNNFPNRKNQGDEYPNTIKIFPNPTNGKLNIVCSKEIPKGTIKIFNFTMQFQEYHFNGKEMSLDLTGYPKGLYYLQIETPHEVFIDKIIRL